VPFYVLCITGPIPALGHLANYETRASIAGLRMRTRAGAGGRPSPASWIFLAGIRLGARALLLEAPRGTAGAVAAGLTFRAVLLWGLVARAVPPRAHHWG